MSDVQAKLRQDIEDAIYKVRLTKATYVKEVSDEPFTKLDPEIMAKFNEIIRDLERALEK